MRRLFFAPSNGSRQLGQILRKNFVSNFKNLETCLGFKTYFMEIFFRFIPGVARISCAEGIFENGIMPFPCNGILVVVGCLPRI